MRNGNCVGIAQVSARHVGVGDSKDRDGHVLRFEPDEWRAFIAGIKHGEFAGMRLLPLMVVAVTSAGTVITAIGYVATHVHW